MKPIQLILVVAVSVLIAFAHLAEAQTRSGTTFAPPPGASGPSGLAAPTTGRVPFKACCESCPAGGCTGCNAHADTPNLSCGAGLIKANCQVVDDTATCVRDDS